MDARYRPRYIRLVDQPAKVSLAAGVSTREFSLPLPQVKVGQHRAVNEQSPERRVGPLDLLVIVTAVGRRSSAQRMVTRPCPRALPAPTDN